MNIFTPTGNNHISGEVQTREVIIDTAAACVALFTTFPKVKSHKSRIIRNLKHNNYKDAIIISIDF